MSELVYQNLLAHANTAIALLVMSLTLFERTQLGITFLETRETVTKVLMGYFCNSTSYLDSARVMTKRKLLAWCFICVFSGVCPLPLFFGVCVQGVINFLGSRGNERFT